MVSPRKAAELAFKIFCTPFDHKMTAQQPPIFKKAEKISFEQDGINIRGYRWMSVRSNGKKILIVHGFRSYAYKFEHYVADLLVKGFEVIVFDAPAHGSSDGKLINAYIYKRAIDSIEKRYGPFYGLMGHSLGGLAASLSFEAMSDLSRRKLVLIAPAETETAIKNFFELVPVNVKIRGALTELINEITDNPISYYSVARVVKNISAPVLWVHDRDDTICPFTDVKPLLSLGLPHVHFHITGKLGHNKVYRDEDVRNTITRFFAGGIS